MAPTLSQCAVNTRLESTTADKQGHLRLTDWTPLTLHCPGDPEAKLRDVHGKTRDAAIPIRFRPRSSPKNLENPINSDLPKHSNNPPAAMLQQRLSSRQNPRIKSIINQTLRKLLCRFAWANGEGNADPELISLPMHPFSPSVSARTKQAMSCAPEGSSP